MERCVGDHDEDLKAVPNRNRRDFSMTDADDLKKAHAQLVKQRRSIIEALAKGYERGQTENHIDLLLKIQAAIEVLDTLVDEDERRGGRRIGIIAVDGKPARVKGTAISFASPENMRLLIKYLPDGHSGMLAILALALLFAIVLR
jgi:hypothetical protein